MTAKSARDSILDAAESIVAEQGASFMTMDAVAAKAGVSKGGLIYHFPTQEILLETLIGRFKERVSRRRQEIRESLPDDAARDVVAYILTRSNLCAKARRTGGGLLAAVMRAPQLVKPVQSTCKNVLKPILNSTGNPDRMAILVMAADCIWLLDLLGIQTFSEAELTRIKAEIVKLAYEWCGVKQSPGKEPMLPTTCIDAD